MATTAVAMSPDVLITIKIQVGAENRRFKLPLKDLGATTLPEKLRALLGVPPVESVVFERYSDSAGTYITLDSDNPSVYKQLYRAAKAKLKLRIKATIGDATPPSTGATPVKPALVVQNPTTSLYNELQDLAKLNGLTHSSLGKADTSAPANSTFMKASAPPSSEAQRQAYAQFIQESMSAYSKTIGRDITRTDSSRTGSLGSSASTVDAFEKGKQPSVEEAPVPYSFCDGKPAVEQPRNVSRSSFTVHCNNCNNIIPDTHWHCSICDDGDYDLCRECVSGGVHCGVEGHFLIKRSIESGRVINSTTETIPKKLVGEKFDRNAPTATVLEPTQETQSDSNGLSRTCNSCVANFDESYFVTCMVCEDYDLCVPCHLGLKHGHHPAHAFKPASAALKLDEKASLLCEPGRNARHLAICDGCDNDINGVRHKCLDCPDWDYCSTCFKSARQIHPGHRFVPVYESISGTSGKPPVHYGINCDGPLCKGKHGQSWIVGNRYKCAVCHDTDFCANCEALPTHRHNRTHPLIKFRTPIRNVSVSTISDQENGEPTITTGDRLPQTSSKSTETTPVKSQSANVATQVQTMAEVKPSEATARYDSQPGTVCDLQATFICDTIPDGSKIASGKTFQQVWFLHNPGPKPWPVGCSVRYIGGDNNMLNVDEEHPSGISDIAKATTSNVINRTVEVDEGVHFYVTMKSSHRPGKAISYWRLKTADGIPFGHKLWCDIDVVFPSEINNAVEEAVETKPEPIEPTREEAAAATIVSDEPQIEDDSNNCESQHSQMIFPKLDKESPVSSTHQAAEKPALPAVQTASVQEDNLHEDLEALELEDDTSTDGDGFLTDEDYEILEAESDEEAVNGKGKK